MSNPGSLVINLNTFCTNQDKREQTKLTINSDEITSVYDLKTKIQELCQAPVCDQRLFYLGQPLSDPTTKLSELYLRDGDTINVEFLEKVDIVEFDECIRKLKRFLSSAPALCSTDGDYLHVASFVRDYDTIDALYVDIGEPLGSLFMKFSPWKTVQVKANRHYFVQEGGLQVLVELLQYSQKEYSWICADDDDDDEDHHYAYRSEELVETCNQWQMFLCHNVLHTLWCFLETGHGSDIQLVLDMGILGKIIDSYMKSDDYDGPYPHLAARLRESALGCLCGLVEYDKNVQVQVAARIRSSTLCAIPPGQSTAIDSFIERFVQEYNPRRIAEYEESVTCVWKTLHPMVHMAFAGGRWRYSVEKAICHEVDKKNTAANDLSTATSSAFSMEADNCGSQVHPPFTEAAQIEVGNPKTAKWPGSSAVQNFAIFTLQNTLYSRDNRQLLQAEDLDSYLICLQWQLKEGAEYDKLTKELLMVNGEEFKVPRLTVICKSVLASMHGLDAVHKL